jgi:diaminopimelate decarboxylase
MFLVGTQRINDAGHLEIGGCDTVTLARHFETPLYVFDEADIRDRCRTYRAAFESRYPHVTIAYAGKAFLTPAMARLIDQEGFDLDVASGGELHVARVANFPARRLVFHGNNKSPRELNEALDAGVVYTEPGFIRFREPEPVVLLFLAPDAPKRVVRR